MEFPKLSESMEYCNDLPYTEMGIFAEFTQEAKSTTNWFFYGRAVRLAAKFFPSADENLVNELNVSYLEHLDFEGPQGLTAWRLLPVDLQRAWHEQIDYNEKLLGRPWVQTKPKVSE